mmetsp:Transcript_887/g.1388  ORF Transcript_887/g.1388 Transcript_887/m.1388 type:complete len:212 (-) Transcript_887:79-714(-)
MPTIAKKSNTTVVMDSGVTVADNSSNTIQNGKKVPATAPCQIDQGGRNHVTPRQMSLKPNASPKSPAHLPMAEKHAFLKAQISQVAACMEVTLKRNARLEVDDASNPASQIPFRYDDPPITVTSFRQDEASLLKEISLWKEKPPTKVENALKIRLLGSYFFPQRGKSHDVVNEALEEAAKTDFIPAAKIVFGAASALLSKMNDFTPTAGTK